MPKTAAKLTYKDYLHFPEDLLRHEIIDGEHYVTPSPITKHQKVSINLVVVLHNWVSAKSLGTILSAPIDVVFSNTDIFVPDIIFISTARASVIHHKNIQGAPDLIIEILSPSTSTRDLGIKKASYEKFGVSEYWVVDPEKQTVDIFTVIGAKFSVPKHLTVHDLLSSTIFQGLQISVKTIFES